ncbi:MAG: exodeoxyribonuclease VII large subunit, partial [Candidatus Theseobacter exili]|nr:exodeoxyribonuclease VII large subunit [Candidatus Theseobacter exili]
HIPIISAVGHEIDWTISDFVADLRVPTPSAAAERVVIARKELVERLNVLSDRIKTGLVRKMEHWKTRVLLAKKSAVFSEPVGKVRQYQQAIDESYEKMCMKMSYRIELGNRGIASKAEKLETLSPLNVLKRGYSLTTKSANGNVIKNVNTLNVGEDILTTFSKGRIISKINKIL